MGKLPTIVAYAALALIVLGHALLNAGHTIDDAAISYAYARNLALGQGFIFQPGAETVEGATNLLWVVLLAAGLRVGLDPVVVSKALGVALTVGIVWLVAGFPGWSSHHPDASPDPRVNAGLRLFAALLVALAAPVALWSVAGLETALFGFLMLAGCAALVAGADAGRGDGPLPLAFLLFLAAALTRPEGALILAVGAVLGFAWWIGRWRTGRGAAGWGLGLAIGVAIGVIGLGGLTTWRLATFTYPFPNTFYAKAGPRSLTDLAGYLGDPADPGWGYLVRFATEYPVLPALVLVLASLPLLRSPAGQAVAAMLAAGLIAVVYEGGDDMIAYRFLAPLIPFGALAVARAIAALTRLGPDLPAGARALGIATGAGVVGRRKVRSQRWPLLLAVPIGALWILPNLHRTVAERVDPLATYPEVRRVADRIDRALAGAGIVAPTVLTPDIGGFGYGGSRESGVGSRECADPSPRLPMADLPIADCLVGYGPDRLRVIDLGRLVDTTLAHQGYRRPIFTDYIFDQRRPTFIRTQHHWTTDTRLIDEPALVADYLGLRRWTDGGAAAGEWVRRDVLVSPDLPGETKIVPPTDRTGLVEGLEPRGWEDVTLPGEADRRRIWLYWARTGAVSGRPAVTVGLGGPDGRPVAAVDHTPTGGLLPADRWPEGGIVRDFVDLPLPAGLPAGDYSLTIGPAGPGAARAIGRVRVGDAGPPAALRAIDPALARGDLTAAVGAFRRLAAGRAPGDGDLLPILDRIREGAAALVQSSSDGRTAARLAAEVWPFSGWGRLPDAFGPAADRCAAEAGWAAGTGDPVGAIDWQRCASDLLPGDAARRHALENLRDRAYPRTVPTIPAGVTPVEATFGRRIRLLGHAIDPAPPLPAGRPVTLRLYFDTLAPVATDYEVYVHLEWPGNRVGADHYPPVATSRWRPGEIVPDQVAFTLPPGTDRPVAIWVGLWDRREALPVTAGSAENDGQRVRLADLTVRSGP